MIEDIISYSVRDAEISKDIKKDIKIGDLTAVSEIDEDFNDDSQLIYERKKTSSFNTSTGIRFQPFGI